MYSVPEVDTRNKARVKLFCIGRTQETLPPTSDAATFHIMRSHYQASVWNQAHSLYPDLPPVTEMGWIHLDGRLVPRLLSLSLTYPESLQGDHLMWLYEGVPQPTLQLQEHSYGIHRACNCRTLGDNCRNTHDDQE